MLQQTQVATVLGYFQRFIDKFPNVQALAAGSEDEVLALWSGLGYYTRARNLHRCAKAVVETWKGKFPSTAQELETLPGIGRSTAGAIASFCFSERVPILDANVRRVLTRVLAFDADLASVKNERLLWDLAQQLCPEDDLQQSMPRYTQGMMDLGASLCLPRDPQCLICPIHQQCAAARQGNPQDFPVRTRKIKRSSQAWWLLIVTDQKNRVWLQRRPSTGIWAGLYSPPIFESQQALEDFALTLWPGLSMDQWQYLPSFLHVLTHRDLHLHPVVAHLTHATASAISEPNQDIWAPPSELASIGLPAPIRKLLTE